MFILCYLENNSFRAVWDFKKFSSEDDYYSKILSNYTVQELLKNNAIHYTRHLIDDASTGEMVLKKEHLWFKGDSIECNSSIAKVKPKYITFNKM